MQQHMRLHSTTPVTPTINTATNTRPRCCRLALQALQGAVPDADLIINILLAVNLHPDTIATALAAAEQGIVHPIPGALIHQPGTILSAPPPTLPPSAAAAGVKPELGVKPEYGEEGKAGPMVGMKRRGSEGDGFEGDGGAMGIAAGAQDVYRIRAQKRMMHGDG